MHSEAPQPACAAAAVRPSASATEDSHAADAAHTPAKAILAEKFKTKPCRNWQQSGHCPYEQRCMFAHRAEELRTKEMNIRDGLVTDEAIRNWRRMQAMKAQVAQTQAAADGARRAPAPARAAYHARPHPYNVHNTHAGSAAPIVDVHPAAPADVHPHGYGYAHHGYEESYEGYYGAGAGEAYGPAPAAPCPCPECLHAAWEAEAAYAPAPVPAPAPRVYCHNPYAPVLPYELRYDSPSDPAPVAAPEYVEAGCTAVDNLSGTFTRGWGETAPLPVACEAP